MARVKRGVVAKARHKKILRKAKGYYGARSKLYKTAQFRALWIARINAASRLHGLSYSRLINGLNLANIEVDRKVLADIAVHDPEGFGAIAEQAKASLAESS
jgi:large subunit ribosomal protein L20